ncbi:MAG TPA: pentapeptide repeat-containing protein [Coleofasciculaceae cyanobacterium]|jgi:uncharacterized protein YjbI with pentapeptide repeats
MLDKILAFPKNKQWVWIISALSLVLILIWLPQYQVASLRQEVIALRRQNPAAVQEIINAEKAALDAETAARVALIQGMGLILITGGFSILNYKFTKDKQIEERFDKSLEQLQSENIYIRVSSISRLEQHTRDKEQDTRQVIHILAAYIRNKSALATSAVQENSTEALPLLVDIQEAMNVILSLKRAHNSTDYKIDLSRTDLRKLVLPPKADLRGVNFQDTNLQGAELSEVDLQNSILIRANFKAAHLDKADFRGANFLFAMFEGASAESANFQGTNVVASHFEQAKLKGAKFQGANCRQTRFDQANLEGADFREADLLYTFFTEAKGIDLEEISRQAKSCENMVGLDGDFYTPKSTP